MTKRNKILDRSFEAPAAPVVQTSEGPVPTSNDQERQAFVDFAAVHLYARHFQAPKCFVQAEELWAQRTLWLLKHKAAK